MSNTEPVPLETVCSSDGGQDIQILPPRMVPLGGPRSMTVRRTLPQRKRSLVGAWCFLDSYGPDDVSESNGMNVARHPHTGLATVSWLFTGEIDHLDSAGNSAVVRPGEMNLMLAGRGITHQEFSTAQTRVLHGAQLWYALPESTRHGEHDFVHYVPEPVAGSGWSLRVFLGSLAGSTAPVDTRTPPLLGAELVVEPGASVELGLDPSFEHALLVDRGAPRADGVEIPVDHLAYFSPGRSTLTVTTHDDDAAPTRLLLLGGVPLGEEIVMWWNFIGRSHEEVVAYRAIYQHEIGVDGPPDEVVLAAAGLSADHAQRFGPYPAGQPQALPAPPLPNARLRSRS
ncbi:pirin family protein [Kocuria sp.]|uniref:pirin family protein n=1 Tax=Kocuria sp. TaxID=1871328 RepID=UPI0026DEFA74|nr:pirin family protein [Kocuria sp.]MDO5618159.1 pirin family protein [Kocuria sp.]